MHHLHKFTAKYTLEQIIDIEHQDEQFLALQKSRDIIKQYDNSKKAQELFIFLTVQNALIAFQIAGSGPLRRKEFADKIKENFHILKKLQRNNTQRRYEFLINSRYNKRLYNNKRKRLDKFVQQRPDTQNFIPLYEDMHTLRNLLTKTMEQDPKSKTILFTIKMFGYATRIVTNKFVYYPQNIPIPVDSRLIKIHQTIEEKDKAKTSEQKKIVNQKIQSWYQTIADTYNIPPLHLDSLIRIKYRNTYYKQ
jgi:DNA-(apurinic or apyrimidinic site) lyase